MSFSVIGCIGCGAMGSALLSGIRSRYPEISLYGSDHTMSKVKACGAKPTDLNTLAQQADLIIVAVKPYAVRNVLCSLAAAIPDGRHPVVVSVAAGVSLRVLREAVNGKAAVVRCMPNTPAQVAMGSFGMCFDDPALTPQDKTSVISLFASFGRVIELAEDKFPAFCALVGCGPAYIFYVIEALAEAGVKMGFSRAQALDMASYLCAGSARMAMEPNAHPTLLREAVCSPAGSTIEGIAVLDERAVKAAFVAALEAAKKKS